MKCNYSYPNVIWFVLLLTAFPSSVFSSCPLRDIPINERVETSSLIVEGKVTEKISFYTPAKDFIYTRHVVKVLKVFKGEIREDFISYITEGGVVGLEMLKVTPSAEMACGETGVFFLTASDKPFVKEFPHHTYELVTGPLGIVFYNTIEDRAFDYKHSYGSIASEFLPTLQSYTGQYRLISNEETDKQRRNTPQIFSFTPTEIPAGTNQILTIMGIGFGTSRGNGGVLFRNADNGGSGFTQAFSNDIVSWSDTSIQLKVKRQAGTGTIRVRHHSGNLANSIDTLFIPWSHLNVELGDTIGHQVSHIPLNNNNGISWIWDTRFYQNKEAVSAFVRALETWRCRTLIPWDTISPQANDTNLRDQKCMVFFDKGWLPSSTLGVCYSWYNGCFNAQNGIDWIVAELDIVFRASENWYYGTGNPGSGRTDFESVSLHELGHGHQLGHVIDRRKVMHFSLGKNEARRSVHPDDIASGFYVMNKNKSGVCGLPPVLSLKEDECRFTGFTPRITVSKTNPCQLEPIRFEDESIGDIRTYLWVFGPDASSDSVYGKGPHHIYYLTQGNKNVRLVLIGGDDTLNPLISSADFNQVIQVRNNAVPKAGFDVEYSGNQIFNFKDKSLGDDKFYVWNFGDGSALSFNPNPTHTYSSDPAGITVNQRVSNECGEDNTSVTLQSYLSFHTLNPPHHIQWKAYPNPFEQTVYLDFKGNGSEQISRIEWIDINGRCVLTSSSSGILDVRSLKHGVYLLRIITDREVYTLKMIKSLQ
jgi:hypothetical protein